jgi:hypothetical protein
MTREIMMEWLNEFSSKKQTSSVIVDHQKSRIGRFKNNLFTVIFNGFKKKVKLDDQFLDKKSMKLELLLCDY